MRTFGKSTSKGLTLIEVLAVIVILALIMGAAVINLGATDSHAQTRAMMHDLRRLDRAARHLARTEGAALIEWSETEQQLVLRQPRTGEVIRRVGWPQWMTVRMAGPSPSTDAPIAYDAAGRSEDLRIEIDADGRRLVLAIHGLTGASEELTEGHP